MTHIPKNKLKFLVQELLDNVTQGNLEQTIQVLADLGRPAISQIKADEATQETGTLRAKAAVLALNRITPSTHPLVSEYLFTNDNSKAEIAIAAISEHRMAKYCEHLSELIRDNQLSHPNQVLAVDAIAKFGTLESLGYLVRIGKKCNHTSALERAQTYLEIVLPMPESEIEKGLCSRKEDKRRQMAKTMASFGAKAIPFLKYYIFNFPLRPGVDAARESLSQITDPEAIPVLADILTDSSMDIVEPAIAALKNFGELAMPAISKIFKYDPAAALRAYAEIDLPSATAAILEAAKSKSSDVRADAIRALCRKGKENIHIAIRALDDPDEKVAEAARFGLSANGYVGTVLAHLRNKARLDPANRLKYGKFMDEAAADAKKYSGTSAMAAEVSISLEGLDLKRFPTQLKKASTIRKQNTIPAKVPAVA